MAAVIHDTFTGSAGPLLSHVGEVGATWTRHPATTALSSWELDGSGRIYATGGGYNPARYLASGVPAASEYDVAGRLHVASLIGDRYSGVLFRYDPTADSGYILRYASGAQSWNLMTIAAGVEGSTLGTYADIIGAGNGRDFRVEVRDSGTRIAVKLDGVIRITSNDTTYTATGRVGLYNVSDSVGSPDHGLHLDTIAAGEPGFTIPTGGGGGGGVYYPIKVKAGGGLSLKFKS